MGLVALALQLLNYALGIFQFMLIAVMVLSFVRLINPNWRPEGPLLLLIDLVYRVTDPPLNLVRKIIPPLQLGSIRFDLAFLVVFLSSSYLQFFITGIIRSLLTA